MHKGTNRRIAKQGWGTLEQSGGASVTPEVSRTGDFDGHRSGGGSSQPGLLRREATPFSPLNLAAADQSNGGSLMTTHAAAATTAAASTTVDAPGAQQQQRQQQEPRQQTRFGEDGQPHQQGGGEQAQEDQNFDQAEQQEGTSGELSGMISRGERVVLRVDLDEGISRSLGGKPIGQESDPRTFPMGLSVRKTPGRRRRESRGEPGGREWKGSSRLFSTLYWLTCLCGENPTSCRSGRRGEEEKKAHHHQQPLFLLISSLLQHTSLVISLQSSLWGRLWRYGKWCQCLQWSRRFAATRWSC